MKLLEALDLHSEVCIEGDFDGDDKELYIDGKLFFKTEKGKERGVDLLEWWWCLNILLISFPSLEWIYPNTKMRYNNLSERFEIGDYHEPIYNERIPYAVGKRIELTCNQIKVLLANNRRFNDGLNVGLGFSDKCTCDCDCDCDTKDECDGYFCKCPNYKQHGVI